MSHHLDYPVPELDITDVFCFSGTNGTVFVMNVAPLQAPAFSPTGLYEFKVDTNGDYVEDITWRVTFQGPPVPGDTQYLRVEELRGSAARDRNATGKLITPDHAKTGQSITCLNGIKLFAGQRGEPFFNDPRFTAAIKAALLTHTKPIFDWYVPGTAINAFQGTNVSAIVLEVPSSITGTGTIGFWANTSLHEGGSWHQVQHAAGPGIGFLYTFLTGSAHADYNASHPTDHLKDSGKGFWKQVANDTAAVVEATGKYNAGQYGKPTPAEYGAYVANTVFPDVLRFKVGTLAEWRARHQNGRGLTEPAAEAIYELVLNNKVDMGLNSRDNATGRLLDSFPYLAKPIFPEIGITDSLLKKLPHNQ